MLFDSWSPEFIRELLETCVPMFRCTSGHLIFCRELNRVISDIDFQVQFNAEFRSNVMVFLQSHIKITKKENRNNTVCFYPARALQKALSKSTCRTVIALGPLANRKQGPSYTFEPCQLYLYLVLV